MPETRERMGRGTVESVLLLGAACPENVAADNAFRRMRSDRRNIIMVRSGQKLETFKRQPDEQALLQHIDRHDNALWVLRIVDVALKAMQRSTLHADMGAFLHQ